MHKQCITDTNLEKYMHKQCITYTNLEKYMHKQCITYTNLFSIEFILVSKNTSPVFPSHPTLFKTTMAYELKLIHTPCITETCTFGSKLNVKTV